MNLVVAKMLSLFDMDEMLRRAGAREVHMRISSPPIRHPCFFGVDMATRRELIASYKNVEEIRQYIGADSLGYLSLDGLIKSIGLPKETFCTTSLGSPW